MSEFELSGISGMSKDAINNSLTIAKGCGLYSPKRIEVALSSPEAEHTDTQ